MGMINIRTGNLMYATLAKDNDTKFVGDFRNEEWLERATREVSKIFFEIIGIEENKIEEKYGKVTLDTYYAYSKNTKELPMSILLSCERNEKDIIIHSNLLKIILVLYFSPNNEYTKHIPNCSFYPEADVKLADFIYKIMCEKDITLNIDNPSSYFITRIRFLLYKKPKDIVRLQHFTNDGKRSELLRINKNGIISTDGNNSCCYPHGFYDITLNDLLQLPTSSQTVYPKMYDC